MTHSTPRQPWNERGCCRSWRLSGRIPNVHRHHPLESPGRQAVRRASSTTWSRLSPTRRPRRQSAYFPSVGQCKVPPTRNNGAHSAATRAASTFKSPNTCQPVVNVRRLGGVADLFRPWSFTSPLPLPVGVSSAAPGKTLWRFNPLVRRGWLAGGGRQSRAET